MREGRKDVGMLWERKGRKDIGIKTYYGEGKEGWMIKKKKIGQVNSSNHLLEMSLGDSQCCGRSRRGCRVDSDTRPSDTD